MAPFTAAISSGRIFVRLDGEPIEVPIDKARMLSTTLGVIVNHAKRKEDCRCKKARSGAVGNSAGANAGAIGE